MRTFEHPQELCAGRLRMTVPGPGATVEYLSANTNINGVYLDTEPLKPGTSFAQRWAENRQELAKTRDFLKVYSGGPDRLGVEHRQKNEHNVSALEIWQNYKTFILKAKVPIQFGTTPELRAVAENSIQTVLDRYHAGDGVPQQPGAFCVAGGWVDLLPTYGEGVETTITLPVQEAPGHQLFIGLTTYVVKNTVSDGLMARIAESDIRDRIDDPTMHILRRGERTFAGVKGHEYAQTSRDHQLPEYSLWAAYAEYGGTGGSLTKPAIEISFLPDPFADPLKAKDVLALWDAFLYHIRVQP